jgi:hypothetical protein
VPEHGQQEGEGLAASGFGDADQIAPRHDRRNRLDLDGSGLLETELLQDVQLLGGDAALGPGLDGFGTTLPCNETRFIMWKRMDRFFSSSRTERAFNQRNHGTLFA